MNDLTKKLSERTALFLDTVIDPRAIAAINSCLEDESPLVTYRDFLNYTLFYYLDDCAGLGQIWNAAEFSGELSEEQERTREKLQEDRHVLVFNLKETEEHGEPVQQYNNLVEFCDSMFAFIEEMSKHAPLDVEGAYGREVAQLYEDALTCLKLFHEHGITDVNTDRYQEIRGLFLSTLDSMEGIAESDEEHRIIGELRGKNPAADIVLDHEAALNLVRTIQGNFSAQEQFYGELLGLVTKVRDDSAELLMDVAQISAGGRIGSGGSADHPRLGPDTDNERAR